MRAGTPVYLSVIQCEENKIFHKGKSISANHQNSEGEKRTYMTHRGPKSSFAFGENWQSEIKVKRGEKNDEALSLTFSY